MMLSLKIIGSQTIQPRMAIKEKELDHLYPEVEQKNKSN